jgi:hypothetical protein
MRAILSEDHERDGPKGSSQRTKNGTRIDEKRPAVTDYLMAAPDLSTVRWQEQSRQE